MLIINAEHNVFFCVFGCVGMPHAANDFLRCVLRVAHYINIDMRASHCACLYAAK